MKNYNQSLYSMKRENKKIIFLFVLAAVLIGIFYDKGAEGNYGWSPDFLNALLVFIVITSFLIIKVFLKSIIDSIRLKTKTSGYKRSLSEIYSTEYYKCSDPNYDNSKRIENLQKLYPLIDKATRDRNCKSYENFLLYKFGQIIFTHNSDNDKKSSNKIDYKIVDNGLNKFFPERNFEPVDIETINKRDNFATKLAEFAAQWGKLQAQYSDHIYKIPEWGTLFTVITLKEENPRVLYSLKNQINDICDNFERNNCYGYRKQFITVANKLYHEKDNSRENLSKIIQTELIDVLAKKHFGLIKLTRKIDKVFVSAMPLFIYFYSLAFMIYQEPKAELLNQLVISFPIAIFSIFLKRFIKNTNGKFQTIAQYEKLVKEEREFLQHKDEIIKAQVYERMNKQTFTSTTYNQSNTINTNYSNNKSDVERQRIIIERERAEAKKQKNIEERERREIGKRKINEEKERKEAERKLKEQEKKKQQNTFYYCEYCGKKFLSVRGLTAEHCYRHPSGANKGFHKLYEGSEKSQYVCKFCGTKAGSISTLTSSHCGRHPNGAYKGFHTPAL